MSTVKKIIKPKTREKKKLKKIGERIFREKVRIFALSAQLSLRSIYYLKPFYFEYQM